MKLTADAVREALGARISADIDAARAVFGEGKITHIDAGLIKRGVDPIEDGLRRGWFPVNEWGGREEEVKQTQLPIGWARFGT